MSKKKAGSYNTPKTKSSNLLPQVFNTDVNKKWLDSTLDQMISKGRLNNIEGYIGDTSGKNRNVDDVYTSGQKLSPTITVKDKNKNLIDAITTDDIANSVNVNFSEYNYSSANATKKYSYRPPINVNKFINYRNYAWVDQMPMYESVRTLNAATVDAANPSIPTGTVFPPTPSNGDYFALDDGGNIKTYMFDALVGWQISKTTDAIYSNNENNEGYTTAINPVELSDNQLQYLIEDNNNTFTLADQMLIKFVGDGWHSDARTHTYLVTGTGIGIKLVPWYSWVYNVQSHPDTTRTTITVGGIWDESTITIVDPNKDSPIWNDIPDELSPDYRTHFGTMLDYYNSDTDRFPLFDGFIFTDAESNKTQFIEDTLVIFGPSWVDSNEENVLDALDYYKVYYTIKQSNGDVYVEKLVDAEYVGTTIRQFVVPGTSEELLAKYKHQLVGFDTLNWDKSTAIVSAKDYIVLETTSPFRTAWSRNNKWTDIATLEKLDTLIFGGIGLKTFMAPDNIARRPIIEFDGKMNLFDWADNKADTQWLGIADFAIDPTGDYEVEKPGSTLRFKYPDKVEINPGSRTVVIFTDGDYQDQVFLCSLNGTDKELTPLIDIEIDNCMYVRSALPDAIDLQWTNSDVWYDGGKWKTGQQRINNNQMPLFKLFTPDGTAIETLNGVVFNGSKVFNYKLGTGHVDPELNHALSYKDVNGRAEYQFENYLFTEDYFQSVLSNADREITYRRPVARQYFFKNCNKLSTLYKQSEEIAGAETLLTADVKSDANDLIIDIGYNAWRTNRVVQLHQADKECVVTELQNGVYLDKTNINHNNIYVGQNIPVVFNNLLETGDVTFKTVAGDDVEPPSFSGVTITRSGFNNNDIELEITTFDEKIIIEPTDTTLTNSYTIIPLHNYDEIDHSVEINGKHVSADQYTIEADSITIPKKLIKVNDIVDVRYANNDNDNRSTNPSVPNTLKHNANNELIKDFTTSETISHWQSIISSTPGFEGDLYAENNYEAINTQTVFGGNLFIYKDLSIVHDALYASHKIDVSNVLTATGEEWDNFKLRFTSQVSRLYATKPYSSVKALVDEALKSITIIRKGGDLYSTSNMVYFEKAKAEKLIIDNTTNFPVLTLKENIHSDSNIQDHVYVYITELNGTELSTRLAVKDTDYYQIGNKINFTYQPVGTVNDYPYIEAYYYQMDTNSNVPPSLTKLRLAPGRKPSYVSGVLRGHDCTIYKAKVDAVVDDMNSNKFDVVLSALFELEKRVYTGLVKGDSINSDEENLHYGFTSMFIPNKSRETWYTLDVVNNALYKHFKKWKAKYSHEDVAPAEYDAGDPKTWNWSTAAVDGHFKTNKLPGHWTGAYEVLFGTQTPHLTPWHMLGHAFKPTWWDTYYSWTDTANGGDDAKRDALKNALKRGSVSTTRQDTEWANHMWDWDSKCPVKTDGTLEDIDQVLGSISAVNAAQEFVFGDWAGTEGVWRNTSTGQAVLIDVLIKLNPVKAFGKFYSPDVPRLEKHLDFLDQDYNINTPASNLIPSKIYKRVISDFGLTTIDQFPRNTFIRLAGPQGGFDAVVTPSFVGSADLRYIDGASISKRGRELTATPAVYTNFTQQQIDTSEFTYKTKHAEHVASGVAQAIYNFVTHNNVDYNIDYLHNDIDIHLATRLSGFTSKHLLDFKTDTFDTTLHTLSENDFELNMYESTPINIAIASSITIEKTIQGWKITGGGYGKQEFAFFEPDTTNSSSYTNVKVGTYEVKNYNNFAPVHSVIDYETKLKKIQDTYSFIRGYYAYLESVGFKFPYSGDSVALSFVKWALASNNGDIKTFDLGTSLNFAPAHGNILELNTGIWKENTVATLDSTSIDTSNLIINREDNGLSIETTDSIIIDSIGFVVVEYDHIAILNDKTTFGVVVHDSVKNISQDRVSFRGLITSDWTGHKRAPGYLVFDNKIVENFDSSVQSIDDYYRTDGIDFNPAITKLEDITIGNSNKNLAIYGNDFDAISKRNYFQGLIKESGQLLPITKIARKFATNNSTVTINEQYMLSRSYFGNTDKLDSVEFTIENNPIQTSTQAIKFSDWEIGETSYDNVLLYKHDDKRFVNPFKNDSADKFTTRDITSIDSVSLTAGAVLDVEATYKAGSTTELGSVYNALDDYAVIPAWVNTKSYKLKDRVRHQGRLLECAVASTTITTASDNITVQGIAVNPTFDYGTIATVDGVATQFADIVKQYDDMVLVGDVASPTVTPDPSNTFAIDGESISFNNPAEVAVVIGPASVTAGIPDPAFSDVTGKSINIATASNNTTIDFDITPSDVIENFTGTNNGITPGDKTENFTGTNNAPGDVVENITGIAAQQTYAISQALSPTTYSISTVTVDGSPYVETTDWTISGQNITFINPTFVGSEAIVITLTHVEDLEDTFTIAETLSPTTWSVAQVTVDGTIVSNYNVVGQDLTFTTGPAEGDPIVVTLTHVTVVDLEDTFTIAQNIVSTPYFIESVTVSGTPTTNFTVSGQDLIFNAGSEPATGQPIVVTVAHTSVSMTTAEIVAKINSELTADGVSTTPGDDTNGAVFADLDPGVDPVNSRLRIRHWTTDINSDLVISGNATTMVTDLGFATATVTAAPLQQIENQQQPLDLAGIITQINAVVGLPHITASASGNFLRLTSDSNGNRSSLTVTGNIAASIMGTQLSETGVLIDIPVGTTMSDAVQQINDALTTAGKTGVSLTTSGSVVNIISTNPTLVLAGQNDPFLLQAGISEFGTINQVTDDTIDNSIVPAEWIDISHEDPALFNVWVANDSDSTVESINTIKTKFFGWNVYQVQNNGLFPTTAAECPICAGATTADGNDAQITTNVSHNLVVGDYIMLLNTTTVPNIDGIHKVTKVEGTDVFYIDEYIDQCGSASSIMLLRSARFDTIADRTDAFETTQWNFPPGSNVWTDYNTDGDRSVNVFSLNYPNTGGPALDGEGYRAGYLNANVNPGSPPYTLSSIRSATKVITNTDLDNITVYDYDSNTPILDLELYDPMRGIIPGVADAEIDVKSVHDVAIYNTATEETYEVDEDNAWAEEEVGRRWWDTSRVKFYDYDQGDINDKATNWGKQFVGSEIVIWEWTKSTVAPDDYDKAVESGKVMFGTPASGTAYAEFDPVKNQNEYYYTLQTVWNNKTATNDNVYYFWVRNKETIGSKTKNIITSEVENIIADPSANGIYWFSVIDNDAIILSDIWNFVNKKVVVQLNKKLTSNNHQNWVLLSEDSDIIPDYWYTGLVNNLAGHDQNDLRIPDFSRHPYARYGDDRSIRQAWFDDVPTARKNAVDIINRLLTSVNVYDEFKDRFLSTVQTLKFHDDVWSWVDYIAPNHDIQSTYITTAETTEQLEALDVSNYETARIEIIDEDNIDRTEFYTYNSRDGWVLTRKRNATIFWNEIHLGESYAWDIEAWDTTPWSNTSITEWWRGLIALLRDVLFVGNYQSKFNKFFFGMIDYTMSRNLQVDWAMKTSYIRLNVTSELTQQKKYKKDRVGIIEGYVNQVKPFHVKISETNRQFTFIEKLALELDELSHNKVITIKHDNKGANFEGLLLDANSELTKDIVLTNKGTTVKKYVVSEKDAILETHANQTDAEWEITSISDDTGTLVVDVDYYQIDQTLMFTVAPTGNITISLEYLNDIRLEAGDASTIYTDQDGVNGAGIVDGGTASQPDLFNTTDNNELERSTEAHLKPQEVVSIFVQTNRAGATDDTETRTFAYIKDVRSHEYVFALQEDKSTTTTAEIEPTASTISVTTASNLADAEYILVNDEVMHVAVSGSTISILSRAVNGTFEHNHASGSRITDITDVAASYIDPATDSLSVTDRRFNDVGTTLLDSTTTDEAILLTNTGKGIVL